MKNKNFGIEGNGQVCSCGRHEGVGSWSPAERYTQYRRTINRMGKYAPRHMKQYVWD